MNFTKEDVQEWIDVAIFKHANEVLQWAGTVCFMTMYTVMSFFKELHTVQLVAGCLGGALFLVWSLRVNNRQQQIVNVVGVAITLIGLYKSLA